MDKKRTVYVIVILLITVIIVSGIFIYLTYFNKKNINTSISLNDLNNKIEATDEFDSYKMQTIDIDFASSTFLINKDNIKGIIGKIPLINTRADMYVIIQTDSEEIQNIKMAFESYATEYEKQWSNYLPDQYELVKDRIIGIKGNYIYFIISENPDKIEKLIK